MGFDRNRNGGPRGFRSRRNDGSGPRFRKVSGELQKGRDQGERRKGPFRRDRDNDRLRRPIRGRRLIRKRNQKPIPKDKEDLKNDMDRQMRQYWIKSGSNKGKEEAKKDASLASQKMNEEMDEYWKKAKERKQQQQQQQQGEAAEKKAPQL